MRRTVAILLSVLSGIAFVEASGQNGDRDWAQFGRYESTNEDVKRAGRRYDAVFMGNSITDNWAKLDSLFFERNNFAGRGISGQTTSQMLVRFRRDVLELAPRAVVIMAGTNDIARNNGTISLDNILGNIVSMCELARLHNIEVVLCSVPPASGFRWRKDLHPAGDIAELNVMLRRYAEQEGIYWLDYYQSLVDESGGMDEKWSEDGVHPDMRCYVEVFEPMVVKAVGKVLSSEDKTRVK